MFEKFKQRSCELEHIDTGNYTEEEYEGCIIELQRVNRWLGDANVLRATLLRDVAGRKLTQFSVLDVGAGSGELLRVASEWALDRGRHFLGVGLELNQRSAQAILEESNSSIHSVRANALELPFRDGQFEYVICSLFTHHFVDEEVIKIFSEMRRVARHKVFVIDLHRHPIAYLLYTTIGKLVLHTRLLREDGALSILRSFKSNEFIDLARRTSMKNVSVERRFPFRLVLSADGEGGDAIAGASRRRDRAA